MRQRLGDNLHRHDPTIASYACSVGFASGRLNLTHCLQAGVRKTIILDYYQCSSAFCQRFIFDAVSSWVKSTFIAAAASCYLLASFGAT